MKGAAGRQFMAANLLAITLAAIPLAASANLALFSISGQFESGDTFNGTMTVDTEGDAGNGAITMFDVDVDNASITDGFYNVTNVEPSGSGAQSILEIGATNGVGQPYQLMLAVSFTLSPGQASSLGGFTSVVGMGSAATIFAGSVFNPNPGGGFIEINATGSVAAVAEPGVLALLGLGLAGIGFARPRRLN